MMKVFGSLIGVILFMAPAVASATPGICIAYDVVHRRSIVSNIFDIKTADNMPKTQEENAWLKWLSENYPHEIKLHNAQCESYADPARLTKRMEYFKSNESDFGPYYPVVYP